MGSSDNDAVPLEGLSDLDSIEATTSEPSVADLPSDMVADLVVEAHDVLARAQADREIYKLVVESGGSGPEWELLVEALTAYAWGVLEPWIRSREIYPVLSAMFNGVRVWSVAREWLAADPDYREDVIAHTIARALDKLGNSVRTGGPGWDPTKGLALRSYFLNGCLAEFIYVVGREQRWWSIHGPAEEGEAGELVGSGCGALWGSKLGRDPADIVANRLVLIEHLATLSADDRTLLWAHAVGYTHAEIAHLFSGVTAKAIERRPSRLRKHNIVRSR